MTPEFSRPLTLDRAHGAHRFEASADECAALARRFGLAGVGSLIADFTLDREGGDVRAQGHLTAQVVQNCVATGADVPARIEEAFALRFVPAAADHSSDETELESDACEDIEHDGLAIDLGEAAAQTLALALNPFPRAPDADAALKAAGVLSEGEAGPFAALKDLFEKP